MLNVTLFAEHFFSREANGIHTALLQLEDHFKTSDGISFSFNNITAETDVIHAHTVGPRYLWHSLRHRQRLVVTAHVIPNICLGGVRFDRLCALFTRTYLRVAYNRARLVIAVSPMVNQELRDLGVKTDIVVICNSVDRRKFEPNPARRSEYRQRLHIKPGEFVVLGVGQIQPRKGIRTFVEVAKKLPHLRFVWVGGQPFGRLAAGYEALGRLVKNPPANVTFTGAVPYAEMPGYYALADAFLFPSLHECFSYAILEAGAANLPLVLWDNIDYAAYLHDHYLKARSAEDLAALVNRLYEDAAHYKTWQRRAACLAQRYEFRQFAEQLTENYQLIARQ